MEIALSTHEANGLTTRDIEPARCIERVAVHAATAQNSSY
ncbi:4a-hydroxytetrahydrobiopterin dehydratase family protein [Paraburkholderia phenoliruptrix]|nr:hypothetical protein [Paraburkholderia phenoliruptrix]